MGTRATGGKADANYYLCWNIERLQNGQLSEAIFALDIMAVGYGLHNPDTFIVVAQVNCVSIEYSVRNGAP